MVVKMIKGRLCWSTKLISSLFLVLFLALLGNAAAQVEVEMEAEHLVSLDAYNASLTSVLQILTEKSGLNIVTGPNVEDRTISIRIRDISLEEAIDMVVRASGFSYERIGNSILIETPQMLGEMANLTSFVIQLDHIDAYEARDMIKDLSGYIQVDMAGNRLVVRANPKMKREILQVIEAIDKPALQVMLEAKLVEVSIDALAKLGIDWDKINSITTIVAEAGKDQLPPGFPGAIDTDEIPDEMRFERMKWFNFKDMDWSRQLEAFEIVLDLLINDGTARILADTKLATMNNRDATIHIGDVVPYMVTSFAAGTGGVTEMVTIEREKVGIKLKITPQVNEDGYIITRVEPEVSSIIGFVGPNDEIPWVKTRSASTTVRVKDGETIVIAGLLAEDETTQISKLPLLGDIPYLGKLFQHSMEKKRKTDLIIEITPQVIKG